VARDRSTLHATGNPGRRADGQGWSRQWRTWLRTLGLAEGERSGARVKRLEVTPGLITATVQDRNGASCEVEMRVAMWSEEQWQRVMDALGSQAIFAAQLLAGDLPPEMEQALTTAGVQLLPAGMDELLHRCTCDHPGRRPCEHITAVYLALGDMLADDPWLLFRLRGRDQQTVLRGLRTQRTRSADSSSAPARPADRHQADAGFYRAASVTTADDEIPSLEQQVDGFWGSAKTIDTFRPHIMPSPVELVLLRRLGPPPMGAEGGDAYDRLAALYRRISREALTLAYAVEPESVPENGDAG
jgi:uncharacterized Zn finger protein